MENIKRSGFESAYCFYVIVFLLFALIFSLFVNRDGLLFELENGKPKLILLTHGETFWLLFSVVSRGNSHTLFFSH